MPNPFRRAIENENNMSESTIRFPFFIGLWKITKSFFSFCFSVIKNYGVYLFIPRSWIYALVFLFPLEAWLIHEIRIRGGIDSEKRNACYLVWSEFDDDTDLSIFLLIYGVISNLILAILIICFML